MTDESLFRLLLPLVLIANLAVSGFYRLRARAGGNVVPRSAEPRALRLLRAALVLPYMLVFLAYLIDPRWVAWAALPLPAALRWLGVALGLATVPLAAWILRSLGSNVSETVLIKPRHELVTHGPYRWVRHPLYSAGILMLLAFGLIAGNAFLLAWVVLSVAVFLAVIIPREEAELGRAFGERYRSYRRRSGALLPRFGGK